MEEDVVLNDPADCGENVDFLFPTSQDKKLSVKDLASGFNLGQNETASAFKWKGEWV